MGWVALKPDMTKPYDCVEWKFLWNMLNALGFPSRWVNLIMMCGSMVRYNVLVNKDLVGPIIPTLGIRHGDSLSHICLLYLYWRFITSLNYKRLRSLGKFMVVEWHRESGSPTGYLAHKCLNIYRYYFLVTPICLKKKVINSTFDPLTTNTKILLLIINFNWFCFVGHR